MYCYELIRPNHTSVGFFETINIIENGLRRKYWRGQVIKEKRESDFYFETPDGIWEANYINIWTDDEVI